MLSTGYATYAGGREVGSDSAELDPVSAVLALAEPKARFFMNAIGPAKPYGLVAFTFRFYDGYEVPALDGVTFPGRPGGTSAGPTFGGGLAIDATDKMGGFVEVPWTLLLASDGYYVPDDRAEAPKRYGAIGQLLRLQAGISTRF
jgi:hypothetical protein